jgi:hypothetical protein
MPNLERRAQVAGVMLAGSFVIQQWSKLGRTSKFREATRRRRGCKKQSAVRPINNIG